MTRSFISLFCFLALGLNLNAQTAEDALRYSSVFPLGTARFAGTGGSMTPLGVDFSTLSTNPAGIGWVRSGYFVVSPGFGNSSLNATLRNGEPTNQAISQGKSRFNLPNIGLVLSNETRSIYWPTFNLGIGINRLADYNETLNFRGRSNGSIIDAFVEDANDRIFNEFRNSLAFDNNVQAILQDDQTGLYFSDFDSNPEGFIRREGQVTRTGGLNELVLSMGGNYRDIVMWGFTLGIPYLRFKEVREYDEIDDQNEIDFFDDLSFDETLETTGSGINLKFGLIARPSQALRLSLAVHSPTFWSIDENYETTLVYNFTEDNIAQGGTALSPRSEFAYNLQTPWRLLGGVGTVLGKRGFLALDAEYVSYATNQFSYDDFATEADAVNTAIDTTLRSALALRLGGEANLEPFRVRAGISARQNPLVAADNELLLTYSGGAGFRKDRFFIDAALQYSRSERVFIPYTTFAIEPQRVDTKVNRFDFSISAGLNF